MLATAVGQLRTIDTSSDKRLKKCSGHLVSISSFPLAFSYLIGISLSGLLSTYTDRPNAEDAILTLPKLHTHEKNKETWCNKIQWWY
jgi:hypothetical protein